MPVEATVMLDLEMPIDQMPHDSYTGKRVVKCGTRGGMRGRIDGAVWRGPSLIRGGWMLHIVWQDGTSSLVPQLREGSAWKELRS